MLDQILGELPPNKKFQFPENWSGMCSLCKVMTLAKFALANGFVISLFPATMKTSRLQVYLHPPFVTLLPMPELYVREMIADWADEDNLI